jgi:hypothetical protein
MRKLLGWILTATGGILWILDKIGTFQTAQGLLEHRSGIMRILATVTSSQWIPLSIFILGVIVLVCLQTGLPFWPEKDRPELTPFSTKVVRAGDKYQLQVGVKNTGNVKAIDTQITTVFWRCSGKRKPFTVRKSNANPISQDVSEQVELDFTIEPMEPVFVVMSFAYRSRERGKLRQQYPSFYYRWNGSDSNLVHASKEEREVITQRLKKRETIPPAIEFQGDFEKKSDDDLKIDLIPRWGTPVLTTVVNRSRDYPVHIKAGALYGIWPDGATALIAQTWKHKFEDCTVLPHSLAADRQIRIAFADFTGPPTFERLKGLFVELELENGRKITSPTIPPPGPPERALQIACGLHIDGCHEENQWEAGPVYFLRVYVKTGSSEPIRNCTAFLTRIEKNGEKRWASHGVQLTFSDSKDPDTLAKTVRAKVPYFVDVLVVTSWGEIRPGNMDRVWAYKPRMHEIFAEVGDYILTVIITGDDIEPITALLKFNWTRNWQTSWLTMADQGPAPQHSFSQNFHRSDKPLRPIEIRDLLDALIKKGRSLTEQWKTNFGDYEREQQREIESEHWLSKTSAVVKEHLTIKQFDQFMTRHRTAMDVGKRFTVSMDILNAGVKQESNSFKLAFEVASKLEILERFRSEVTQLS